MREILFRGKNVGNGKWVYGSLIEDCYIVGDVVDWNEEYFNAEWWAMVDPETVGQYTGLTDKNGTKIFEGDIVKSDDGTHAVYGIIKFGKIKTHYAIEGGHQGFYIKWQNYGENKWGDWWREDVYVFIEEIEVICNIHDNPELLEEEVKWITTK